MKEDNKPDQDNTESPATHPEWFVNLQDRKPDPYLHRPADKGVLPRKGAYRIDDLRK